MNLDALGPNLLAFSLTGFLEKLVEGVVNGFLLLLQLIARGLLQLELTISEDLVLRTPAIGPHWFDSPFVVDIPGISGPDGIIHHFYRQTMNVVLLGTALGLFISAIMLVAGFMPNWRAAAKENLLRTPLFLVMALMAPWFLQFFIDLNTMLVGIGFPDSATYVDLRDSLWDNLLAPRDLGDQFGQLIGLLVAAIALLIVMLELATRYGVILFIGAISPLVIMGLAFNFTRGFATKALKLFIAVVFFQGFTAIAIRLMLEVVVAYGDGGGIATWALLSGMAATIAYLPKVLSGAGEAVANGSKVLKVTAAAAIGGTAMAARGISGSSSPKPAQGGAGGPAPPATGGGDPGRGFARPATFSRGVGEAPAPAPPHIRRHTLVEPPTEAPPSRPRPALAGSLALGLGGSQRPPPMPERPEEPHTSKPAANASPSPSKDRRESPAQRTARPGQQERAGKPFFADDKADGKAPPHP